MKLNCVSLALESASITYVRRRLENCMILIVGLEGPSLVSNSEASGGFEFASVVTSYVNED